MKILLFSNERYPFFISVANALFTRGYDIHVCCFRNLYVTNNIVNLNKQITFYNDLVIDIDNNKLKFLLIPLLIKKLKKVIKIVNPDILHVFNLKWAGWLAAAIGFSPFILTGMGSDILKEQDAEKNIFLKRLRSFTIKKADFITVVSDQMGKQIKEVNPYVQTCFFAPGANPEKFSFGKTQKLTKEKFKNFEYIVFSPRAMKPIYQTKEIVMAFAEFQNKYKNSLLIIGGKTNSCFAREVKNIIDKKGLSEYTYFTGHVTHEQWLDYYRISDAVVSYPANDGMPATIFEAMAMKRALILSDVPSIQKIVSHGQDGHLCDVKNYKSLVQGFKDVLLNYDYRNNLVENAYLTFNLKGNTLKLIGNLEDAYKEVLNIS